MSLVELEIGQLATVESVNVDPNQSLGRRLAAMGLTVNKPIQVLRKAGFGGPLHIRVGSTTEIAIRRQEAAYIVVKPQQDSTLQ